jgi:hypothetical protein
MFEMRMSCFSLSSVYRSPTVDCFCVVCTAIFLLRICLWMIARTCVSHLSYSYYLTRSSLFKCYIYIRAAKSMTRSR